MNRTLSRNKNSLKTARFKKKLHFEGKKVSFCCSAFLARVNFVSAWDKSPDSCANRQKIKKDVEHLASRIPLKCEGFFLLLPLNELSAIKTRTKEKLSRNKTIPETSFESKSFYKKICGGLFYERNLIFGLVWANWSV